MQVLNNELQLTEPKPDIKRGPGRPRNPQSEAPEGYTPQDNHYNDNDNTDFPSEVEIQNFYSTEEKIDAIIQEISDNGINDVFTHLMKYNQTGGKWEQVISYGNDSVPTKHDIGLSFGGGKYEIRFSWKIPGAKARKNRSVSFTLSNTYDQMKKEKDQENKKAELQVLAGGGSNTDMIMMMMKMSQDSSDRMMQMQQQSTDRMMQMFGMIIPAIAGKGGGTDSVLATLLPTLINGHNNRENIKYESEVRMLERGIEIGKLNSAGPDDEQNAITKMIVQGLIDKAPDILSVFSPKAVVRSELRKTPGIDRVLTNPNQLKQIYRGVADELGEDKAKRIADKAGIEIPGINTTQPTETPINTPTGGMKVMVT
jgi:hypothetical protein